MPIAAYFVGNLSQFCCYLHLDLLQPPRNIKCRNGVLMSLNDSKNLRKPKVFETFPFLASYLVVNLWKYLENPQGHSSSPDQYPDIPALLPEIDDQD